MKPCEFSKGKEGQENQSQGRWCDGSTGQIQWERFEDAMMLALTMEEPQANRQWYLTQQLSTVQREARKGKKLDSFCKRKATMQTFLFQQGESHLDF